MNVVFMGTPEFAVPCLHRIIEEGHTVRGVFCQPDRPKGRGYRLAPPPVKERAALSGIPVFQPESLKGGEALGILRELSPELVAVVAYGRILPPEFLRLPPYGCVNIHASLLPRYRGAAPIQWAVVRGERETGVTSMYMAEGLDTGDMIIKKSLEIGENETAGELHDRLSLLGAGVLAETLRMIGEGRAPREKQDEALATLAPMIKKEDARIDWSKPGAEIHNLVRGMNPWPVAFTEAGGKVLKIYKTRLYQGNRPGQPGEILENNESDGLLVGCGTGALYVTELQAEGKKRMAPADYFRGNPIPRDMVLGRRKGD